MPRLTEDTVMRRCVISGWRFNEDVGANVPGKPRVFMPLLGFPPYAQKCAGVADHEYEGFTLK